MLCTVALRRTPGSAAPAMYALRVSGKTALGPSGTGGQDIHEHLTAADVMAALRTLALSERDLTVAQAMLRESRADDRFAVLVADAQIPFETLEAAEFDLFD